MQAWKEDYPWLQVAFKNWGGDWRVASESWRVRIEDELNAALDFKVRGDGTATVWCGMSGHDFHHFARVTPSGLGIDGQEELEGLAVAGVKALGMVTCAAHVESRNRGSRERELGPPRCRLRNRGYSPGFWQRWRWVRSWPAPGTWGVPARVPKDRASRASRSPR